MASRKNQVVLTFAGDSRDLEKSFDKVGKSANKMSKDTVDSFGKVGNAADDVDTKAMGFRDTVTGVQDTFKGLTDDSLTMQERMLTLGMGIGDLASGVANFGVDFAKTAGKTVANYGRMAAASTATGIKMAAAWVVGLGPVGWAIAGITAVIGILAALGVGFDDVKRVAAAAWDGIVKGAQWVWDKVGAFWDWLYGMGARLWGLGGDIKDALLWPYKTAFNAIAGIWNNTVGKLSFEIPGWVPGLGGKGFSMPQLPTYAIGGMVQGMPGSPQLVMAHAGERIVRNSQTNGGMNGNGTQVIRLEVDGKTLAQVVRDNDRDYARLGGR